MGTLVKVLDHVSVEMLLTCCFSTHDRRPDEDECVVSNGGCDHTCDNDEGSFVCHWNDGFLLEEDGFTCTSTLFRKQK